MNRKKRASGMVGRRIHKEPSGCQWYKEKPRYIIEAGAMRRRNVIADTMNTSSIALMIAASHLGTFMRCLSRSMKGESKARKLRTQTVRATITGLALIPHSFMFQSPPRNPNIGYLAFKPGKFPSSAYYIPSPESVPPPPPPPPRTPSPATTASLSDDEQIEREQRIRQLEEQEREEIRKGEEEWVKSGGILRDARGKRDILRTRAVREELALRAKEKELLDRWNVYLQRWSNLQTATPSELRFVDFPWPVDVPGGGGGVTLEDLDSVQRIQEFFLEPLSVRGTMTSKKSRIRSSLLLWHPDKLSRFMLRVVEEEADEVQKGINQVNSAYLLSRNDDWTHSFCRLLWL